jgi:L-ribulose-5-phosphate 3-epimerase
MNKQITRRDFGRNLALGALALSAGSSVSFAGDIRASRQEKLSVHLFSKVLQFLDYRQMADASAEMGFDGLDLTVRPGGHVAPERVKEELPLAIAEMRAHGLRPQIITTDIKEKPDGYAAATLGTAAAHGVKYYRMDWWRFREQSSWKEDMILYSQRMSELARVNESLGLHGAYQNHSGEYVGSYLPDLAYCLDGLNPDWIGCQFDIRHATVEGFGAWPLGLRVLKNHIRTIVVKDFAWSTGAGVAKPVGVPIGTGTVDFKKFFKLLRQLKITPLVVLHAEYELGGAETGSREIRQEPKKVFGALKTDLLAVQELWEASGV